MLSLFSYCNAPEEWSLKWSLRDLYTVTRDIHRGKCISHEDQVFDDEDAEADVD